MKKYIIPIILLCFACTSWAGNLQKKVIARKNVCTEQFDLPTTKDDYDSRYLGTVGKDYAAMRLSIASGFTGTKIELYCDSVGADRTGTITAYIYSKTGATASTDVPNTPLATSTNTLNKADIAATSHFAFFFEGYTFSVDSYWIVLRCSTTGETDWIKLGDDSTDSEAFRYSADGIEWSIYDASSHGYLKLSDGGCE